MNLCPIIYRTECSQLSCLKCCTDLDCVIHNMLRAQALEKMTILNGTHPINLQADERRKKTIKPGTFSETSFKYIGDSVILFSLKDYFSDTKIRDDIIRKSKNRRNAKRTHA